MNIMITGSAGFIGYHISQKLLSLGHTVIGIDNLNNYYNPQLKIDRNTILKKFPKYKFYQINIADSKKLSKVFSELTDYNRLQPIKLIHLAAQAGVRYSLTHPLIYEESNIRGFINILEEARKMKIRDIVYASSSSVYGNNRVPKKGFSEKDPVDNPISLYAATKKADELIAYTYHHLYGLNCTGLRFFTVYGPWGRPDMAYFKFTRAISTGKTIDVFNQGNMYRDFTYIDDIVDGIYAALIKTYPFEIINLGNSRAVSLTYFIKCIENALGKKAKIKMLPIQPGDLKRTYADISLGRIKLNYKPRTTIKKGIMHFVTWYKDYYSNRI